MAAIPIARVLARVHALEESLQLIDGRLSNEITVRFTMMQKLEEYMSSRLPPQIHEWESKWENVDAQFGLLNQRLDSHIANHLEETRKLETSIGQTTALVAGLEKRIAHELGDHTFAGGHWLTWASSIKYDVNVIADMMNTLLSACRPAQTVAPYQPLCNAVCGRPMSDDESPLVCGGRVPSRVAAEPPRADAGMPCWSGTRPIFAPFCPSRVQHGRAD